MREPKSAVVHRYPFTVLESHLDSFGHMNNAKYLQILEEARWDFITRRGYGFDRVHELQKGPTILEVTLRFSRELKLRQDFIIESKVIGVTGKIMDLEQTILSADGKDVYCTAVFRVALFDMQARKLIAPTKEWLEATGVTLDG